jgi:membrane protease YdiL (CAAX protease family)
LSDPAFDARLTPDDTTVRWWEPLAAFVGGNILGSVPLFAVVAVMLVAHRGLTPLDVAAAAMPFSASYVAIMGTLLFSDAAMLGLTYWLAWRRVARPFAFYLPAVSPQTMALAAASGAALSLLLNGGNQLLQNAGLVNFTDTALERMLVPHGVFQFALSALAVSLVAPLAEEFIFRGLLMRWLMPFARATGAVLVSGLIFGLVHGQYLQHPGVQGWLLTAELGLAGVVLGAWAARTGSLRTSFATHAAFNLTATLLSVFWP